MSSFARKEEASPQQRPRQSKRVWRDLHGWLLLDKPAGMTSAQAVARVKYALQVKKIGHAGTLDPMATGMLPMAMGRATKQIETMMHGLKHYRFTIRWGQQTDTDDCEGRLVASTDSRPTEAALTALLPAWVGDEVWQIPPRFSALKVNGQRAYDLARAGVEFCLMPRPVMIKALTIVDWPDQAHTELEMMCGRGTYVRSLARDLGAQLGVYGHVVGLRRLAVGAFAAEQMWSLQEIEGLDRYSDLRHYLIPA